MSEGLLKLDPIPFSKQMLCLFATNVWIGCIVVGVNFVQARFLPSRVFETCCGFYLEMCLHILLSKRRHCA